MFGLMKVPKHKNAWNSEDVYHHEAQKGWNLEDFEVHASRKRWKFQA